MRIVLRAEAKANGLKRYFTGLPCSAGHVAERLTSNGSCCVCSKIKQVAAYRSDPRSNLARQKRYREATKSERSAKAKAARRDADPSMLIRDRDREQREAARAADASMYESCRPCAKCQTGLRFSGDGKCVECNRRSCRERHVVSENWAAARLAAKLRRELHEHRAAPFRAARAARQAAMRDDALTYIGRPCEHGHAGLRYTRGGSCFACAASAVSSEERKKYDAAYYSQNRERILARTKEYVSTRRESIIAKAKEWARLNPEKRRAISINYKHRRRAKEASGVSYVELLEWKKEQKKVCYWCGCKCPVGFVVDHYVPLAKGGLHALSNLVIACRKCNARKSAKDPLEFARSIGRLF